MTELVKIDSQRFGRIEAKSSDLIHFDGLPGFPRARRFVLLRHDRESHFAWLVSADDPTLAFVVTDPRDFFPEYRPELAPGKLRSVCGEGDEQLELLTIADVRAGEVYLNLAAPLVLNPANRRAIQVILDRGNHSSREVLRPRAEPPRKR